MAQDSSAGRGPADGTKSAVDPRNAELQRQVKADHDALQDQARRSEATAGAAASTPITGDMNERASSGRGSSDTTSAARNANTAHANAEAQREQARRVDATTPEGLKG